MLGWSYPLGFLRAALLCALIVLGLGPKTSDAHVGDPMGSVASDAHGVAAQEQTRAFVENALGHCHSGLDCAVTAIPVGSAQIRLANALFREGFRSGHIRHAGLSLSDDPPPPRPFV